MTLPPVFLRPAVLLLIKEQSSYGYDIAGRLPSLGFKTQGQKLYGILRALEEQGAVRSEWQFSDVGPARRIYHLTSHGDIVLAGLVGDMEATHASLTRYMDRYSEACGD